MSSLTGPLPAELNTVFDICYMSTGYSVMVYILWFIRITALNCDVSGRSLVRLSLTQPSARLGVNSVDRNCGCQRGSRAGPARTCVGSGGSAAPRTHAPGRTNGSTAGELVLPAASQTSALGPVFPLERCFLFLPDASGPSLLLFVFSAGAPRCWMRICAL